MFIPFWVLMVCKCLCKPRGRDGIGTEEINLGGIHEWREVLCQACSGPHNQSLPRSQVARPCWPRCPHPLPGQPIRILPGKSRCCAVREKPKHRHGYVSLRATRYMHSGKLLGTDSCVWVYGKKLNGVFHNFFFFQPNFGVFSDPHIFSSNLNSELIVLRNFLV